MRLLHRARQRLTYANVMATLALFIALGGTSYAALTLPKNSVGSKQIRRAPFGGRSFTQARSARGASRTARSGRAILRWRRERA
jgi:hypothetical protein